LRERFKIWWELLKPGWKWLVLAPLTLLGIIGTIRDQLIAPEHPWLKLVYWLPHWTWSTYLLLIVFGWFVLVLEGSYQAIKKRDNQLHDRHKKKEKRLALAGFLEQGQRLEDRYDIFGCAPATEAVDKWNQSIEKYLIAEFDISYVARFRNYDGIRQQGLVHLRIDQNNCRYALQRGNRRLGEFIQELHDD
jgi:hypothetical protein